MSDEKHEDFKRWLLRIVSEMPDTSLSIDDTARAPRGGRVHELESQVVALEAANAEANRQLAAEKSWRVFYEKHYDEMRAELLEMLDAHA